MYIIRVITDQQLQELEGHLPKKINELVKAGSG